MVYNLYFPFNIQVLKLNYLDLIINSYPLSSISFKYISLPYIVFIDHRRRD